jgi:flagellar protein FliS
MSATASKYSAYTRVDVETASQGKLIVMLFNGAIKRAEEAKRQLDKGKREGVHNNLIRAQEIIGELRGALNLQAGPVAKNLDRVYEYFQYLLIQANIKKLPEPIEECVELMTNMRDTWQELFANLAKEDAPIATSPMPASINQHGNSLLNIKG